MSVVGNYVTLSQMIQNQEECDALFESFVRQTRACGDQSALVFFKGQAFVITASEAFDRFVVRTRPMQTIVTQSLLIIPFSRILDMSWHDHETLRIDVESSGFIIPVSLRAAETVIGSFLDVFSKSRQENSLLAG